MVRILFKTRLGEEYPVDIDPGYSVMEAAYNNNVPGIEAECGGSASCATCHVYVDPNWFAETGPVRDNEQSMLYFANNRPRVNSRLSCQIRVDEALDGLVVEIADNNF